MPHRGAAWLHLFVRSSDFAQYVQLLLLCGSYAFNTSGSSALLPVTDYFCICKRPTSQWSWLRWANKMLPSHANSAKTPQTLSARPTRPPLSISDAHTSKWLMALRTMTCAMSGVCSLAGTLLCERLCEYPCVWAYLMSAGLIHTHLPPDNWNHTTRLLTSSHQHTHTRS